MNTDNPGQSPQGSTQNMTVANLFTAPTMAGPLLVTGSANATTVTISSLNGNVGNATVNRAMFGNSGSASAFTIDVYGGGHAKANQVEIFNRQAASLTLGTNATAALTIDASQKAVFASTATATRLIAAADITSAVAKGVFSDGTYSTHDAAVTSALGMVTSFTNTNTSGSFFAGKAQLQTNIAGSGSNYGFHSSSIAEHTSGTINQIKALAGIAWAAGNGGTTTSLVALNAGIVTRTGAVATNAYGLMVSAADNVGTITNLYGLYVEAVTAGGTLNYALKTNGGRVGLGSLPTSSAGLASGDLWNNSGVVNIV